MSEPTTLAIRSLDSEQTDLIRRTICKGSTDDELMLFIGQCNRTGLDPFSRQIHAVKRYDSKLKHEVMSIQVGIDGFRVIAERSGKLDGQEGPFWCGEDGIWKDVWLDDKPPSAAKVLVYRKGCSKPFTGIARYRTYVQTTRDGGPNIFWSAKADVMIAKCAEVVALRKAFPMDLSGLYAPEEVGEDAESAPVVRTQPNQQQPAKQPDTPAIANDPQPATGEVVTDAELFELESLLRGKDQIVCDRLLKWANAPSVAKFPRSKYQEAVRRLKSMGQAS